MQKTHDSQQTRKPILAERLDSQPTRNPRAWLFLMALLTDLAHEAGCTNTDVCLSSQTVWGCWPCLPEKWPHPRADLASTALGRPEPGRSSFIAHLLSSAPFLGCKRLEAFTHYTPWLLHALWVRKETRRFPGEPAVKTPHIPRQGPCVCSLVGELRSCTPGRAPCPLKKDKRQFPCAPLAPTEYMQNGHSAEQTQCTMWLEKHLQGLPWCSSS